MESIKDKTAIVGIGLTEIGSVTRPLPYSMYSLTCQAIMAAIDDAGLQPKDINGMMTFDIDGNDPARLANTLGLNLRFAGRTIWGGSGPQACVGQAAAAVAAGLADCVVAFRGVRIGRMTKALTGKDVGSRGEVGHQHTAGLISPAAAIGLGMCRYMYLYGTTRDHFANVALACRKHANRNPNAFFYDRPLTREEYFKAPIIAYPCCLYDCCLESEGAVAIIVTSAERAKHLKQPPIYIMAAAQGGLGYSYHGQFLVKPVDVFKDEVWHMAQTLYKMAGITPANVDCAQIFESFTLTVLMELEGLGFCKQGEGGPFTEGGNIEWPNGKLPVSTAGGNLSEGYLHGLNHTIEAVKQLRGTSTAQVKDCEIVLVSGANAVPSSGIILRK